MAGAFHHLTALKSTLGVATGKAGKDGAVRDGGDAERDGGGTGK